MREIIFRGKRFDNGEWVQGDLFQQLEGNKIIHYYDLFMRKAADIEPKTVCQYTGLTDKNGKKIFEGDILKSDLGKAGKIEFNESLMAFMILEFNENKYYHVEECSGNHMEIIGNIFDNPELLK